MLKGDNIAAMDFWHGRRLNEWAEAWVKYFTGGAGTFATSAMEDTGTLQSLAALTRAGKADVRRALVLRTVSNFTMPWPGATPAQSLPMSDGLGDKQYSAYIPSLDAAHRVGSRVVHELVNGWAAYGKTPPR